MARTILALSLLLLVRNLGMGNGDNTCTTKFRPKRITYNAGSEKRCIEAVAFGIEIHTKEIEGFFTLPSAKLADLETKIGDKIVTIEVQYFEEPDDKSGAVGWVKKIWLKSELVYMEY